MISVTNLCINYTKDELMEMLSQSKNSIKRLMIKRAVKKYEGQKYKELRDKIAKFEFEYNVEILATTHDKSELEDALYRRVYLEHSSLSSFSDRCLKVAIERYDRKDYTDAREMIIWQNQQ